MEFYLYLCDFPLKFEFYLTQLNFHLEFKLLEQNPWV